MQCPTCGQTCLTKAQKVAAAIRVIEQLHDDLEAQRVYVEDFPPMLIARLRRALTISQVRARNKRASTS